MKTRGSYKFVSAALTLPMLWVVAMSGACARRQQGYTRSEPTQPSQSQAVQAGSEQETRSPAPTVHTYVREWAIDPQPARVEAGNVSFQVHNQGSMKHELLVMKTSLPATQLPVGSDDVVHLGEGMEVMVEIEPEDLPGGAVAQKSVVLASGHYVLICNIPGHYARGLRADFEVS